MSLSPELRSPRLLVALVAALTLALLALAGAPRAQAAAACGAQLSGVTPINIAPSCFEAGDGNMSVDGPAGNLDWRSFLVNPADATLPAAYVTPDGTGGTDNTFVSGKKEEDPANWAFNQSPSSPKDDLLAAAKADDAVSGHVLAYLGAITKGHSGSMDLSFEFNQQSKPWTTAVPTTFTDATGTHTTTTLMPGRQTGDLLIAFDTNGSAVSIGGCVWKGTATNGAWYLLPTSPGVSPVVAPDPSDPRLSTIALDDNANPFNKACTPLSTTTTPAALGSVNAAPMTAADNVFTAQPLLADQFAELAVDLTAALTNADVSQPCFDFGSVWLRTRSSNQVSSTPEDLVLPQPLHASSCTISGTKYLDANGNGVQDPGESALPGWKYELLKADGTDTGRSAITGADGVYSFGDVPVGDYRVKELGHYVGPADSTGTFVGYADTAFVCTEPGQTAAAGATPRSCVSPTLTLDASHLTRTQDFGNFLPATVTVHKTEGSNPVAAGDTWTFTLAPKGGAVLQTLTQDASGNVSFDGVAPGDYTLCETNIPAGWFSSIGPITDGSACEDMTLAAGQNATPQVDNLHPALRVTKTQLDTTSNPGGTPTHDTAASPLLVHAGDVIAYTVLVENTDTHHTDLQVSPADLGCDGGTLTAPAGVTPGIGSGKSWLAAGGSWTFTCTYTVTGSEPADTKANTASATGQDALGDQVSGTDTVYASVLAPGLTVDKAQRIDGSGAAFTHDTAASPLPVHVGDTIDYSVAVRNDGNTELSFAAPGAIADPICDSAPAARDAAGALVDLATAKLPAGATWTFTCSHAVLSTEPGDQVDNTFSATGTDDAGLAVGPVSDTVHANVLKPSTLLLKAGVDYVHHGDTITYTFTVTNDGNVDLHDVYVHDTKCPADPHLDGTLLVGGSVTLSCDMAVPAHQDGEADPIHNVAQAFGTDTGAKNVASNESTADARILHPHLAVDKQVRVGGTGIFADGPVTSYVGNTLEYRIVVTNDGGDSSVPTPLTVSLSDPRCDAGTLSGPAGVTLGSSVLPSGQSWTFTCSHVVTAADGTAYRNVATATGVDRLGGARGTVTASDEADARIVHPTVSIDKTGPATATAGSLVPYTLVVTNTGDEAFSAPRVVVSDDRCEAPPVLVSVNGDGSPGTFDPNDAWTYTCSVQSAASDTAIHNTGFVDALDTGGRHATASDAADTTLSPISVLPETLKRATARLRGPQGCIATHRASTVVVRGKRIASATFYVDGRKVRTLRRAAGGRYVYRLDGHRLRYGSHLVTVKIRFVAKSTLRTKTLRMRINRCRPVVVPAFTG